MVYTRKHVPKILFLHLSFLNKGFIILSLQFIYLFIGGFLPSQPYRVTSGLTLYFQIIFIVTIQYETKAYAILIHENIISSLLLLCTLYSLDLDRMETKANPINKSTRKSDTNQNDHHKDEKETQRAFFGAVPHV